MLQSLEVSVEHWTQSSPKDSKEIDVGDKYYIQISNIKNFSKDVVGEWNLKF